MTVEELAAELKREYERAWLAANRDKKVEYNRRYREKKAREGRGNDRQGEN